MYYKTLILTLMRAAVLSVAFAAAGVANAAEKNTIDLSQYPLTVQDEITRTECGDCHMIFPPGRLTMNGWKKIMSTLDDHFGEDATIDDASVKHITKYMVSKAFDAKNSVPSRMVIKQWKKKGIVDPIRITDISKWKSHHKSKKYKLMTKDVKYDRGSNCIICHKNAERGMYEEFPGKYGLD